MFKRKDQAADLCVLRVDIRVSDLAGVVFADCNASSDYVRFLDPQQSRLLDFDEIYAMDWRHPNDPVAFYRHRSRKCAEVLVPHRIDPKFLIGGYVVDNVAGQKLNAQGFGLSVVIDPVLFFQ
jgi:hypothetical protein